MSFRTIEPNVEEYVVLPAEAYIMFQRGVFRRFLVNGEPVTAVLYSDRRVKPDQFIGVTFQFSTPDEDADEDLQTFNGIEVGFNEFVTVTIHG